MISTKELTKEEYTRYRAVYCGLCNKLKLHHGAISRLTLTYDMTFLAMFLSSLYEEKEADSSQRCPVHPIRKHHCVSSPATDYAADMSVLLTYYKCLDDWNDDHSVVALQKSKVFQSKAQAVELLWPRQCFAVKRGIEILTEMERNNEMNPDLPANCFGIIMGELFVRDEDEYSAPLRRMGAALGRFIYMMDAVSDLKSDIKKERYNPLVSFTDTDFTTMLSLLIVECTKEFENLHPERDANIMRNILYSGVWTKYTVKERDE
jgi:hypothetical protein